MTTGFYFRNLGFELERYVLDEITIDQLADVMSKIDFNGGEAAEKERNLLWHAIYQYETDIMSADRIYVNGIRSSMAEIIVRLKNNGENLERALDRYFNHPGSAQNSASFLCHNAKRNE